MNQSTPHSSLYTANITGIVINAFYVVSMSVLPFFIQIIFTLIMYFLAYVLLVLGIVSFFKLKDGPKYIPLLLVATSVVAALLTLQVDQKLQNIPL